MSKINLKDWINSAQKELKEKKLEELSWETPEGIKVKPLYTEEDIKQLDLQEEVLNEAANVMADFIYYSFNPAIILTKEAS